MIPIMQGAPMKDSMGTSTTHNKSLHILKKNSKDTDGIESMVSMDRNFCGEYWDEFCLPILAHSHDQQVVWMLGTGLAGGLRPMLMTNKVKEVFGVDIDARSLQRAESIHREHRFKTVCTDASNFIKQKKRRGEKADIIWIDLFDSDGHLPLVFDPKFLDSVLSTLNDTGILAINVFGIPCDILLGLNGKSYDAMRRSLGSLGLVAREIPYRRNITFLVTKSPMQPSMVTNIDSFDLNDRIWLDICSQRLNGSLSLPRLVKTDRLDIDFQSISDNMRSYWRDAQKILNIDPSMMQTNVQDACANILNSNPMSSAIFSIFLASQVLMADQVNAALNAISKASSSSPDMVRTYYHLPQFFALHARNRCGDMDRLASFFL